jgi:hypothetical protein
MQIFGFAICGTYLRTARLHDTYVHDKVIFSSLEPPSDGLGREISKLDQMFRSVSF